KLRQDASCVRNRSGKNHVERRKAVGGDDQEPIVEFVDVPNLSSGSKFESAKIRLRNYVQLWRSHGVVVLVLQGGPYSSAASREVNGEEKVEAIGENHDEKNRLT